MDLANRAKKPMGQGVDTPAHIGSMTPTGNTDKPGGTEYLITLTISPAGATRTRSRRISTSTLLRP
jgi:hypothetical protein